MLTKRQREVLAAYAEQRPGFVPDVILTWLHTGSHHRRSVRLQAMIKVLHRLEAKGLIETGWGGPRVSGVTVTEAGKKVLEDI